MPGAAEGEDVTLGELLRDLERQVPRKILVIEQIDTAKKDRTMQTDHDKLREAIRRVRAYRNGKEPFMIDAAEPTTNVCIDMVLSAAESTLPKTKTVEMKRWALFVHGKQVNITEDAHMAEMWKRGCVGEDFVVEFTGIAEIPA